MKKSERNTKIILLCLLTSVVVIMSACAKEEERELEPLIPEEIEITEPEDDSIEVNDGINNYDDNSNIILQLSSILGQKGDDVNSLFDGGVEEHSVDNEATNGMNFTTRIFGEDTMIRTQYDEEKIIRSIRVEFLQAGFNNIREAVESIYGVASQVPELDEDEITYLYWEEGNTKIGLTNDHEVVTLDFAYIEETIDLSDD